MIQLEKGMIVDCYEINAKGYIEKYKVKLIEYQYDNLLPTTECWTVHCINESGEIEEDVLYRWIYNSKEKITRVEDVIKQQRIRKLFDK